LKKNRRTKKMNKVIVAVYGEKAAVILTNYIESITDNQKYAIMDGIVDVLQANTDRPELTDEEAMSLIRSTFERIAEIIPNRKEEFEEEVRDLQVELCPTISK
jgi:RNAse (barnase) inhibitor barstar